MDLKFYQKPNGSLNLEVHIEPSQQATFIRLLECLRDIRLRKLQEEGKAVWSIGAPTQAQLDEIYKLAPWINEDAE